MMEAVESAVDLIEHMLRAGGVPVHNQQKNFTLINGTHNVPGIFRCYIPGRIPAFDPFALQRLDNVLHKLGGGVMMITDKDNMFHKDTSQHEQ